MHSHGFGIRTTAQEAANAYQRSADEKTGDRVIRLNALENQGAIGSAKTKIVLQRILNRQVTRYICAVI